MARRCVTAFFGMLRKKMLHFVCFHMEKDLDLIFQDYIMIAEVTKMKILNIGSCNIDYIYSINHIVEAGETQTTYKLETFPGGKGLNQSIAAAKAGAAVYHAGCIGCDADMLTNILEENSVDISYINKTQQKNGHAVIQVNQAGENAIFIYPGSNKMVSKAYIMTAK